MAKFKDSKGNEWILKLNVGVIEDIKDQTKVDLDDLVNDTEKLATLILSQPRLLVGILYVMCMSQIEERGIDPRTFGKLFDRETVDPAGDALIEAIVDFYPRHSAGRVVKENLPRMLKTMDDKITRHMEKQMKDTLLRNATD